VVTLRTQLLTGRAEIANPYSESEKGKNGKEETEKKSKKVPLVATKER